MAATPPPRRPLLPNYGGSEEWTPRPESLSERVVRLEGYRERDRHELNGVAYELKIIGDELREVAHAVRALTERKKFHDKLVLAAATLLVTGLLGFLLRLSWWVQAARLP